ncbi:3-hydroxy-3-methylglutaryl-coenzyme A reductase isoform X2 [Daktulosphaira vitifoliae]|uniref:3-hydroxy-3-methylglutaryl-coenzyme A reductase isoform X2 n=1 Tax=Daktulosphaira vitifoliae TaxID=58002 RepID=UPI0021AA0E87|nr:3-hydroxy-3-methylglutaryl-coenzyme A reductase isoform X2 [Daktulosphaira vitifoliae]
MFDNIFGGIGKGCASHPWEVIVGVLTITACMLSMDKTPDPILSAVPNIPLHSSKIDDETHAIDVIFMTLIRCIAVLYCYYQFNNLRQLESKYVLGIAAMFTVFSTFVFSTIVIHYLNGDLKDAMFLFLLVLLVNLKKASLLAQFALSGCSQSDVINNISKGMSLIGPSFSLDSIVCSLVISVGMLSGVQRLETLCLFTCMSFIVNYVVMMSFYPACLSLVLDLLRGGDENGMPFWGDRSQITAICNDHKTDPITQRVKVIMSVGVMIVHAQSRWALSGMETETDNMLGIQVTKFAAFNETEENNQRSVQNSIIHWMASGADHIVILILLLSMIVWFWFFGDRDELANHFASVNQPLLFNTSKNVLIRDVLKITQHSESQTDNYIQNSELLDKIVQTDIGNNDEHEKDSILRSFDECLSIFKTQKSAEKLNDTEVMMLIKKNYIKPYMLEKCVNDPERGVGLRRKVISEENNLENALKKLPYVGYDYSKVLGTNCENVIGYVAVPVGVAGPLLVDDVFYQVPMATTEGCLVASTNRGCRALTLCGGVVTRVVDDGMTRGPVVRFSSVTTASEAKLWMDNPENFQIIKSAFDSTSRFARLTKLLVRIAGRHLFIRFTAFTGDAMGMNMLSKGTEESLKVIGMYFPDMDVLSLSGNFCSDKKPAAVNWIEGRGKYVVSEAVVPSKIVTDVLKTTVRALVDVNISKNLMGSAIAGSIGGNNAHAANIVTAIYIATGQDPAQNVASSNCMTLMEAFGDDLYVSCTMPSVEIGTVGGGTALPGQSACLEMLGVRGPNSQSPGENAKRLARILCATVLAGELSLMSALTAGHLVQSHMAHNRSSTTIRPVINALETQSALIPKFTDCLSRVT